MLIPDGGCLCETFVPENTCFGNNSIPTSKDSFLLYLYSGGTEYDTYSGEKFIGTSITMKKMKRGIDSSSIGKENSDKVSNHPLINV